MTENTPNPLNVEPPVVAGDTPVELRSRNRKRNRIIAAILAAIAIFVVGASLAAQPQPAEVPAPTPTAKFALPAPAKVSPFDQIVENSAQQIGKTGVTVVMIGSDPNLPTTVVFDPTATGPVNESKTTTTVIDADQHVGPLTSFTKGAKIHTAFFFSADLQNGLSRYSAAQWGSIPDGVKNADGTWSDAKNARLPTYTVNADGLISKIVSNDQANPFTVTLTYSVDADGHALFSAPEASDPANQY